MDTAPSLASFLEQPELGRPALLICEPGPHAQAFERALSAIDGHDQYRGLPVLVCTAADHRDLAPRSAVAGRAATALLYKPFHLDDLLAQISRLRAVAVPVARPNHAFSDGRWATVLGGMVSRL